MTEDEITIDVSCIWKDIVGYEGLYQISNFGNVKSVKHLKTKSVREDKIMKQFKNNCGYFYINLTKKNKYKTFLVSRLVAFAFIENPNNYREVDHINRFKRDNRVENLRWADRQLQNLNRDLVLNAKRISICFSKTDKCFIVGWAYIIGKVKRKLFATRLEADAFAETLDKTLLKPLKKPKSKLII